MKQMNGKYVYGIYGHDVKTKNLETIRLYGFQGHPFRVEYDRLFLNRRKALGEREYWFL